MVKVNVPSVKEKKLIEVIHIYDGRPCRWIVNRRLICIMKVISNFDEKVREIFV